MRLGPHGHRHGGHRLDDTASDVLADADGVVRLTSRLVDTRNTHGTGCTLSSALAALRPQRADWRTTATDAKNWLTEALAHSDELQIGLTDQGHGPVHHFHALWA